MTDDNRVILDYTTRDYLAIRSALVGLAEGYMPEWSTVGEPGDFGTLLLEMFAYTGDIMNYYIDRMVSEAFLGTAVRRQSVLFIADMLGYTPAQVNAAVVPVTFKWAWDSGSTSVFDTEFIIAKAEVEGDTVTLTLTDAGETPLSVDQTIGVENLGAPYDGVFNIYDVVVSDSEEPTKITYRITRQDPEIPYTVIDATGRGRIFTGEVILIPSGAVLSASTSDGTAVNFELNFDVMLDSNLAQPVNASEATGELAVYGYGAATEGTTVNPAVLGVSKKVPGSEFVIPKAGVIDGTIEVFTREGQQTIPWTKLSKISFAGPRQSVYTTYTDDQNFTHILFGDDIAGRIPPADAEILVGYRYGVGAAANKLGKNTVTTLQSDEAANAGVTVTNPRSPSGGADIESVESMRYSIPRAESIQDRGVTLKDFESLAMQVPGVTKAVAYGSTYGAVYVRIASSAESTPYSTTNVTHLRLIGPIVTAVLEEDVTSSMGPTSTVVVTVTEDIGPILVTDTATVPFDVVSTRPKTLPVDLESVSIVVGDASLGRAAEFITTGIHGLVKDTIVELSGVDELLGVTGIDGVNYVTAVGYVEALDGVREATKFQVNLGDLVVPYTDVTLFTDEAVGTVTGLPTVSITTVLLPFAPALYESPGASLSFTPPIMSDLMKGVESYLDDRKLVGSLVYAEPLEWEDIVIRVQVTVSDRYSRTAVEEAVQSKLESLLAYDNVDFGKTITDGLIYRTVLGTEGVSHALLTNLTTASDFDEDALVVEVVTTDALKVPRLAPGVNDDMVSAVGGLANT